MPYEQDQVQQPAPVAAMPARCHRCSADVSRLPVAARFCPRCGLEVHAPASMDAAVVTDDAVWEQLASHWLRVTGAPPSGDGQGGERVHSLILLGYANAMYNLGFRYELGRGAARNPREAVRCYLKAARLGNPWALARLAPRDPHLPEH